MAASIWFAMMAGEAGRGMEDAETAVEALREAVARAREGVRTRAVVEGSLSGFNRLANRALKGGKNVTHPPRSSFALMVCLR